MTSDMPYTQINRELNKRVPAGKAYFQAGATVTTPTLPAIQEVIAIQARFRSEIPQARHMVGIELYPMEKVVAVPNDDVAFCCRGSHSNVIINVSWAAEDVDKVDVGEVRKRVGQIVKALQGKEGDGRTRYGNYGESRSAWVRWGRADDTEGDQPIGDDKVRKLFGGNYRKLQTIKAKYE